MKKLTPTTIILLVLLGISALSTQIWLFRPTQQFQSDKTRHISRVFPGWEQLDEGIISQSEIKGLETQDILKRYYTDGRRTIEVVVAYIPKSSRKSAHAQEACLRGGGALVSDIRSIQVPDLPVKATSILLDNHNRKSLVWYWYKIAGNYTSDYAKSSMIMFFRGFFNKEDEGTALIRLLTPLGQDESPSQAVVRLQSLTKVLLPELEKNLR